VSYSKVVVESRGTIGKRIEIDTAALVRYMPTCIVRSRSCRWTLNRRLRRASSIALHCTVRRCTVPHGTVQCCTAPYSALCTSTRFIRRETGQATSLMRMNPCCCLAWGLSSTGTAARGAPPGPCVRARSFNTSDVQRAKPQGFLLLGQAFAGSSPPEV
jgi:hypothetical protein